MIDLSNKLDTILIKYKNIEKSLFQQNTLDKEALIKLNEIIDEIK